MATKKAKATRNIDTLRNIVEHHQHAKLSFTDGPTCAVDAFTANALMTVYNALRPDLQTKFEQMITTHRGFIRTVKFTWKVVK
jgi:hypothetical protein